jgi:hypothetical protein
MQGMEELTTEESFQFAQLDSRLPKSWVLLDNQSTVNIFYNKALLRDIMVTNHCMRVCCNVGWMVTNKIRRFPGYPGEVWYNPDGIANIISLIDVEKYFHVRYDSEQEQGISSSSLSKTSFQIAPWGARIFLQQRLFLAQT